MEAATKEQRINLFENIGGRELKTVKDFYNDYKPNRYTYHNIGNTDAEDLQRKVKYLNTFKDSKIYSTAISEIERINSRVNELDFIKRYKIADILIHNIIH